MEIARYEAASDHSPRELTQPVWFGVVSARKRDDLLYLYLPAGFLAREASYVIYVRPQDRYGRVRAPELMGRFRVTTASP